MKLTLVKLIKTLQDWRKVSIIVRVELSLLFLSFTVYTFTVICRLLIIHLIAIVVVRVI